MRRGRFVVSGLAVGTTCVVAAVAAVALGFSESSAQTPAPTPSPSASEEQPEQRRELPSQRTKYSKTFLEPDGSYTAEISTQQIHFRVGGQWKEIDTSLEPCASPGCAYRNRQGPFSVEFAATANDREVIAVRDADVNLAYALEGANPSPAVVEENRVRYEEALPGLDLEFEVASSYVKERLVLQRPPAEPVTFRFPLSLTGLEAAEREDGSIVLARKSGEVVFTFPPPLMWDTPVDERSAEPALSERIDVGITGTARAQVLTMTPDFDWLSNPARNYPVTIDPDVTKTPKRDTFIQSNILNTSQALADTLKSGTYDGGATVARSLFEFDVSSLRGAVIKSATFQPFENHSWSCDNSPVQVHRVTTWWGDGVTWPNRPEIGWPELDKVWAAKGYSASCPGGRLSFGVKEAVLKWLDGTWENHGLALRAADEKLNNQWKKYASDEATHKPWLIVNFNDVPRVPSDRRPGTGARVNTARPTLSGIYDDPNPEDGGHLRFQVFDVTDPANEVRVVTTTDTDHGTFANPGERSSWQVPSGVLVEGRRYEWNARSYDHKDFSDWSARNSLVVDLTAPPPPQAVRSPSHPRLVPMADDTVDVEWSAPSGANDVAGYSYVLSTSSTEGVDSTVDTVATEKTFSARAAGDYYFRVATVDEAGNRSSVETYGPIVIRADGADLSFTPTLSDLLVAQSDQMGLERHYAYRALALGTATAYTNLRNGNLVVQTDQLARVPRHGLNVNLRLTYNSGRADRRYHDSGVGKGWTLSLSDVDAGLDGVLGTITSFDLNAPLARGRILDQALQTAGFMLEVTDGDGTVHRFVRPTVEPGGRWESPPGVGLRVREVVDPGTGSVTAYELIRPDGVVYRAEKAKTAAGVELPTWQIVSVTDREGNRLQITYDRFDLPVRAAADALDPLTRVRVDDVRHVRAGETTGEVVLDFRYEEQDGDVTREADLAQIAVLPGAAAIDAGLNDDPSTAADERHRSFTRLVDLDVSDNGVLTGVHENVHTLDPNAAAFQEGARTTSFSYLPTTNALGLSDRRLLDGVTDGLGRSAAIVYERDDAALALAADDPVRVDALVDRRNHRWEYTWGRIEDTGRRTTTVTSPLGFDTKFETSGVASVGTDDNRRAGGNIVQITQPANNAGPVVDRFSWEENLLVKKTDGEGHVTEQFYNDMGLLTKVVLPPPNDPSRSDVPADLTQRVEIAFDWDGVTSYAYDPARCTPPSTSPSPHVSNGGYCDTVAQMDQARYADNYPDHRRVTDFAHDDEGKLTRVVQRATRGGPQSADDPDEIAVPESPDDRATAFTYYEWGGLRTVDGPRTDVQDLTQFGAAGQPGDGYHASGRPFVITDARQNAKRFDYTPYGMVARLEDRAGKITKTLFDERGNVVRVTDAEGNATRHTYDDNDNRTSTVSPLGTQTAVEGDYKTTMSYNANDQRTDTASPGANVGDPAAVSSVSYDADGRVTSKASPVAGSATTYSYYANGQVKSVTVPVGTGQSAVTTYSYDLAGRQTSVESPVANAAGARPLAKTTFTPLGQPSVTSATTDEGAQGRETHYVYNPHGETVSVEGPRSVDGVRGRQEEDRNAFGEVVELRVRNREPGAAESDWLTHRYAYDEAGNRVTYEQPTRDEAVLTTEYRYDALNRLISHTDPFNPQHSVEFTYLPEGQQEKRIDYAGTAQDRVTETAYNDDYTVRSVTTTDTNAENGSEVRLSSCNYAAGASPASGYDADNRVLVRRTVKGGGCEDGSLVSLREFDYDQRGLVRSQVQTVVGGAGRVVREQTFVYRADGALRSTTWIEPSTGTSRTTTYAHSPAGLQETATDWRAGAAATTFSYFPSAAPKSVDLGGAVQGTFGYHPDGSLRSLEWRKPGAVTPVRAHTAIDYDPAGLVTAETVAIEPAGVDASKDTGGTASFTYDLAGRLTQWTSPFRLAKLEQTTEFTTDYVLDDGGNVERETTTVPESEVGVGESREKRVVEYGYGPTSRLTSRQVTERGLLLAGTTTVTSQTFEYNGLGEEISRTTTTDDVDNPLTPASNLTQDSDYDPIGHVDRMSFTGDSAKPTVDYSYTLDNDIVQRTKGGTDERLHFYWGTTDTIAEETGPEGATKVRYFVDAEGRTMAQQKPERWTWLLRDPKGSVATHVDADGAVSAQRAYDPYGAANQGGTSKKKDDEATPDKEDAGAESSLGYQGSYTDDVTGNLLLGPRMYDPTTQRFTTPDFFVGAQSDLALGTDPLTGNRYLFAAANPVAFFENGYEPCPSGADCDYLYTGQRSGSGGGSGGSSPTRDAGLAMLYGPVIDYIPAAVDVAREFRIPPRLLAGIMIAEGTNRSRNEGFVEGSLELAQVLGQDEPGIGLMGMQLSTYIATTVRHLDKFSMPADPSSAHGWRDAFYGDMTNERTSLEYAAAHLTDLRKALPSGRSFTDSRGSTYSRSDLLAYGYNRGEDAMVRVATGASWPGSTSYIQDVRFAGSFAVRWYGYGGY